jgi:ribosome-binding factor A
MSRLDRVNELLKQEISKILQKYIEDPSVGFITVTNVNTNSDLTEAKVYVTSMEEEAKKEKSLKALNHASSYIKYHLNQRIKLKSIPNLKFYEDKSLKKQFRLESIFKKLNKGKDNE